MLRRVAPAAVAVLLVAGCGGAAPPEVTFAVGGASAVARPTQYCDAQLTDCRNDAAAPVELVVSPGTPVQIAVPTDIAATPWAVVFSYRSAAGEQVDQRSPLFAADERSGYTLELPTPQDRLLTAQVQQFGPPPQLDPETGEVEFPARASWVLTATA